MHFKLLDVQPDSILNLYFQQASAAEKDEANVDVIGEIKDIQLWEKLGKDYGIQPSMEVFDNKRCRWIVTATMPFRVFERVKNEHFIFSLEISPSLRLM